MIGLIADNSAEFVNCLRELIEARANIALFPARSSKEELKYMQELVKPDFLLEDLKLPNFKSKCEGRVVFFTSGSSGSPKAVVHSLDKLFLGADASNTFTKLNRQDSWLLSLPLSHVGGFSILLRTLRVGAEALPPISNNLEESINELKPSVLSLVPTQLESLVGKKFPSIRLILLGGASVSAELLEKVDQLPLVSCYGMTEAGSTLCYFDRNGQAVPLSGVDFRIKNNRLWVKSEQLFLGYLEKNSGEVVKENFIGDWFDTGDLVELLPPGKLKIIGRFDKTIISGGENIHPREIEIQAEAISGLRRAAVVSRKDEKWGERPVLFYQAEQTLGSLEVRNELLQKLPKFKVPDLIYRLDEIPRLAMGKINYSKLESILSQSTAPE